MKLLNWATNPNSGVTLVRLPDYNMVVDSGDTNVRPLLVKDGIWEPKSSEIVKQLLKPTDTFVDCGAHWGYYTLLASRLGAKVYAFEPNSANFLLLSVNVALNSVANTTIFPLAVWSNSQLLPFLVERGTTGGSHMQRPDERIREFQTLIMVVATSLDDIFEDDKIDFIKVDCEGSDAHVLQGAKGILEKQSPIIITEHPYIELLESLDYKQIHEFKDEQTTFWEKE